MCASAPGPTHVLFSRSSVEGWSFAAAVTAAEGIEGAVEAGDGGGGIGGAAAMGIGASMGVEGSGGGGSLSVVVS